jgi:hypothetical protein
MTDVKTGWTIHFALMNKASTLGSHGPGHGAHGPSHGSEGHPLRHQQ